MDGCHSTGGETGQVVIEGERGEGRECYTDFVKHSLLKHVCEKLGMPNAQLLNQPTHLWLLHVVNDVAPGRHSRAVVTRAVFMSTQGVCGGQGRESGRIETQERAEESARDCWQQLKTQDNASFYFFPVPQHSPAAP